MTFETFPKRLGVPPTLAARMVTVAMGTFAIAAGIFMTIGFRQEVADSSASGIEEKAGVPASVTPAGRVQPTVDSSDSKEAKAQEPFQLALDAKGKVQYTILDLSPPDGTVSWPCAINNRGQVVGHFFTPSGAQHAFCTAPNRPINLATDDLGTLGGKGSEALGINDRGQVVGWSDISSGARHAFRTAPNQPIHSATDDLGTLGGLTSSATAINSRGQVAGGSHTGSIYHAFRTAPNQPIHPATDDLGVLGVCKLDTLGSGASGINDSGQVVGVSITSSGTQHAFRTAANQAINPATDDLGAGIQGASWATGINNSGQVVGDATLMVQGRVVIRHAFRTAANRPLNPITDDLGSMGQEKSGFCAINNRGQVVGRIHNTFPWRAFLYSGTGPMQDLNDLIAPDSGWTLCAATGINDLGQIVGGGMLGGQRRAFLLTPVRSSKDRQ